MLSAEVAFFRYSGATDSKDKLLRNMTIPSIRYPSMQFVRRPDRDRPGVMGSYTQHISDCCVAKASLESKR
jgi:hypothetical protein